MATINLNKDEYLLDDGNEGKVIVVNLADIPGGRALDVSNWDADIIKVGHIIKHNKVTGEFAPLGVSSGSYASLGENEEYAGVLKHSVEKSKPAAAILTMGQVNAAACPYPITSTIAAGLPQIKFLYM